jgi:hypothetical protein
MNRQASALRQAWMQFACPVCGAAPGQRCKIGPGAFRTIYHYARLMKKPPASETAHQVEERRIA